MRLSREPASYTWVAIPFPLSLDLEVTAAGSAGAPATDAARAVVFVALAAADSGAASTGALSALLPDWTDHSRIRDLSRILSFLPSSRSLRDLVLS